MIINFKEFLQICYDNEQKLTLDDAEFVAAVGKKVIVDKKKLDKKEINRIAKMLGELTN
jgi:hypothetical protein